MSSKQTFIGVDMGATKIHAAEVSLEGKLNDAVLDTPSAGSEQVVMEGLIEAIARVITPDSRAIGVGVPAIVDSRQGIVYDVNFIPSWKKVPVKEQLEARFGLPVLVNNDANCFALGEKHFGCCRAAQNIVAVTLGTGLGAGIIIDNKLYNGKNTGAGEIGSIPYLSQTIEHYCASSFFTMHGTTGQLTYLAAMDDDAAAKTLFAGYGKHLAEALKIILYAYDPEVIVLGGSISKAWQFFMPSVWQHLASFTYPVVIQNLQIKQSTMQYSAVLGAAALAAKWV